MAASPYWTDLSTRDFAALDWARTIVVAPIAAVEQHGPHLPVGVDATIMQGCVERIVERLPRQQSVLFLPIQSIGVSIEHRDFPGTLTLSQGTAFAMMTELLESVIGAGALKLVLLSSHGGNSPLIAQLALELRARRGVLVVTSSFSRFGVPEGLYCAEELRHGIHGGEIETSLMLAFRPDLVDMARAQNFVAATFKFEREYKWLRADRPAGFGWMAQDLSPDGAMGDAAKATAEKGAATAAYWAGAFTELLQDVSAFDLSRLSRRP
jgi:creatinine amidohydrolase